MPTKKIITPLEPGKCYHIYNRGNDKIPLFYKRWHYTLFIALLSENMLSDFDIIAYALIPNHYHLLVRVKDEAKGPFSSSIRRAMIQYVVVINKMEKRTGSLFTKPFRRILVDSEEYLKSLIFYIHYNPVKHRITDDFKSYRFSSYAWYENPETGIVRGDQIKSLFGGIEDYIEFHQSLHEEKQLKKLTLEA